MDRAGLCSLAGCCRYVPQGTVGIVSGASGCKGNNNTKWQQYEQLDEDEDQEKKDEQEEKGPTNMETEEQLLLTPRGRSWLPDGSEDQMLCETLLSLF